MPRGRPKGSKSVISVNMGDLRKMVGDRMFIPVGSKFVHELLLSGGGYDLAPTRRKRLSLTIAENVIK
jgi:hypothetical protein